MANRCAWHLATNKAASNIYNTSAITSTGWPTTLSLASLLLNARGTLASSHGASNIAQHLCGQQVASTCQESDLFFLGSPDPRGHSRRFPKRPMSLAGLARDARGTRRSSCRQTRPWPSSPLSGLTRLRGQLDAMPIKSLSSHHAGVKTTATLRRVAPRRTLMVYDPGACGRTRAWPTGATVMAELRCCHMATTHGVEPG